MNKITVNITSVEEGVNQFGNNQKVCKTDDATYYIPATKRDGSPTKAFGQVSSAGIYEVSISDSGKNIVFATKKSTGTATTPQAQLPNIPKPQTTQYKADPAKIDGMDIANSLNCAVDIVSQQILKYEMTPEQIKETVRDLARYFHEAKATKFIDGHTQDLIEAVKKDFPESKVV